MHNYYQYKCNLTHTDIDKKNDHEKNNILRISHTAARSRLHGTRLHPILRNSELRPNALPQYNRVR